MSAILPFYFSNRIANSIGIFDLSVDYSHYQITPLIPHYIIYLLSIIYLIYTLVNIHVSDNAKDENDDNTDNTDNADNDENTDNDENNDNTTHAVMSGINLSNYYLTMFNWYSQLEGEYNENITTANYKCYHPIGYDKYIISDEDLHKKYIQIIKDLDFEDSNRIKSLNYQAILYFIFYKHGMYIQSHNSTTSPSHNSTTSTTSTTSPTSPSPKSFPSHNFVYKKAYYEYLKMRDYYGGADNFYLDYTHNPDIAVQLTNTLEFHTTHGELNFLEWLVTSGIYDYVICDKNMRYRILAQMAKLKLLKGADFLYFHLIEHITPTLTWDDILSKNDEDSDTGAKEDELRTDEATKLDENTDTENDVHGSQAQNEDETENDENVEEEVDENDTENVEEEFEEEVDENDTENVEEDVEEEVDENDTENVEEDVEEEEEEQEPTYLIERLNNAYVYKVGVSAFKKLSIKMLKHVKTKLNAVFDFFIDE